MGTALGVVCKSEWRNTGAEALRPAGTKQVNVGRLSLLDPGYRFWVSADELDGNG
jgi:hypothetical protein